MQADQDRMPDTTMIWGIALLVGGALLIVFAPLVLTVLATPNSQAWQFGYLAIDTMVQILRQAIAPLGAALVGASLVMRYVDRRLSAGDRLERPHRLVFPRRED